MLGDVLLISDYHRRAAEEIVGEALKMKKNGEKFVIAISGESGSGKTELGHCIGKVFKEMNIRPKLIHTDNYYKSAPLERKKTRKRSGFKSVGYDEYDWLLIQKNIQDFREDRETLMPCIDIIPEQIDKLITNFKDIEVLVLDGLYAIKADDVDLRVFIELTYQETKMNQLARGKETMNEERLKVLEMEHQNVIALRDMTDLFVNIEYKVEKAKK